MSKSRHIDSVLFLTDKGELGCPQYTTKDKRYIATLSGLDKSPREWTVENPSGFDRKFPTLREAEKWVQQRIKLENQHLRRRRNKKRITRRR